jgi:DNA (cytosine-5)-methyltransferase 1
VEAVNSKRLLDLFCGAGGAAMGYHRAGFDVVGVDIAPQPRYPFKFHQGDAMTWPLDGYDVIHASPPCHDHIGRRPAPPDGTGELLPATRELLKDTGLPWIIENVPGAPMRADYRLCGCMFPMLAVRRERWFETSWHGFDLRPPCDHRQPALTIYGRSVDQSHMRADQPNRYVSVGAGREAMGIDWMTLAELAQAIPPPYTEYIGRHLLEHLERAA